MKKANAAERMKVAMVGVGGFGKCRRNDMRGSGLYDIAAVYDHNPQALADAAEEEDALAAESFDHLLETPGIEALFISTGAKYHAQQALAAMERGLHVFVEKPLCSTPEECDRLLAKQRETGLVVGMGHEDHRNKAESRTVKRLLDEGAFGTVASFERTTAHSGGLEMVPGEWRSDPAANPGGMLFQCGVHALHELMYYFGPVKRVSAVMRYDVHGTETADVANCLLEFASGPTGTLNAYHVTPYRHALAIFGTAMSLFNDRRSYGEPSTMLRQRRACQAPEPYEPMPLDPVGDTCGAVKSFYQAVREGGTPYPSIIDGARVLRVVFAAVASAQEGRAIDIQEESAC